MNIIVNIFQSLAIFILILIYLSTFEWAIHRFPMHIKKLGNPWWLPLFRYLYRNHTEEHHPDFVPSKDKYEREDYDHHDITLLKPILLLGMILIGSATLPIWMIDYLAGYQFNLTLWCIPMATIYYIMFETLHVAEHKPNSWARKILGNTPYFRAAQAHHLVHHQKWGVNFNLVCWIADILYGTKQK